MLDGLTETESLQVEAFVSTLSENLGVAPKTIMINYFIANVLLKRGFEDDKVSIVVNNETYTFVNSEYGYNFSIGD